MMETTFCVSVTHTYLTYLIILCTVLGSLKSEVLIILHLLIVIILQAADIRSSHPSLSLILILILSLSWLAGQESLATSLPSTSDIIINLPKRNEETGI